MHAPCIQSEPAATVQFLIAPIILSYSQIEPHCLSVVEQVALYELSIS